MTLEILKIKEELRNLIDAYAFLGDEKNISAQMGLFTTDPTYKVYMNNMLVADIAGTATLEKGFNGHAAQVKSYFTLNGQHVVKINGNSATGISFSQIKMIRESDRKYVLSDYSVKYEDEYMNHDGKWFINARIGHFLIIEARTLEA